MFEDLDTGKRKIQSRTRKPEEGKTNIPELGEGFETLSRLSKKWQLKRVQEDMALLQSPTPLIKLVSFSRTTSVCLVEILSVGK